MVTRRSFGPRCRRTRHGHPPVLRIPAAAGPGHGHPPVLWLPACAGPGHGHPPVLGPPLPPDPVTVTVALSAPVPPDPVTVTAAWTPFARPGRTRRNGTSSAWLGSGPRPGKHRTAFIAPSAGHLWSPNTVRGYATSLAQWWSFLEQRGEAGGACADASSLCGDQQATPACGSGRVPSAAARPASWCECTPAQPPCCPGLLKTSQINIRPGGCCPRFWDDCRRAACPSAWPGGGPGRSGRTGENCGPRQALYGARNGL